MKTHQFRRCTLIAAVAVSSAISASASDIDGKWGGALRLAPGMKLRIVLNISEADSVITMDSPDQGAFGIPGETLFLSEDSVAYSVPKLSMTFNGSRHGDSIDGTFRQGMLTLPLTLTRDVKQLNRPQTPQAPFPYSTEEVMIDNPEGASRLAATLTLPEGYSASTPVVVMISGSGLQDRDETLFGHKPFAVIADYLARRGIASLRYDDRGVGESTGDVANATTLDFASDAKAALNWLRSQKKSGKTGILGHSEGGIIAYMLGAAEAGCPDFIVSVAGPSVKGTRTIAFQNKIGLLGSGVPENYASDFEKAVEKALEYKISDPQVTELNNETLEMLYPGYASDPVSANLALILPEVMAKTTENPWMNWFLAYDPVTDLRGLRVPAMIIYGEKDLQVPPSLNLDLARESAKSADIRTYPGLNHMMQHAGNGTVAEYGEIEETFSPEVLSDIADFILKN